jgi:hypothetical protein
MEEAENKEPPRFCIEVNIPRGGQKLVGVTLHNNVLINYLVTLGCI